MKPAIHYDAEDIKKMLAEKHGVEVKNVIRIQVIVGVMSNGYDPSGYILFSSILVY